MTVEIIINNNYERKKTFLRNFQRAKKKIKEYSKHETQYTLTYLYNSTFYVRLD